MEGKMPKQIVLSFPEENVSATAELLEEAAPETCGFIWNRVPVEGKTVHGRYSGAEIFVFCDPPTPLKPENQVNLPLPGEILYYYQPGGVYAGSPDPFAEICVIYDRNVQLRGAGGVPTFASLFARLSGDWSAFADACKRVRYEGPKLLRITRANTE
jgi:hypothetical protein